MTRFALLTVGLLAVAGVGLRGQPPSDAPVIKTSDDPGSLPVIVKRFADAVNAKLPGKKVEYRFRAEEGYVVAARTVLYAAAGSLRDSGRELAVSFGKTGGPEPGPHFVIEFLTAPDRTAWLALRHTHEAPAVGGPRLHTFTWTSSEWTEEVVTTDALAVAEVLQVSALRDGGGATFVTKATPPPPTKDPPPPIPVAEPLRCDKMVVGVHKLQGNLAVKPQRGVAFPLEAREIKYPNMKAHCLQWLCQGLDIGETFYLEPDHDYPYDVIAQVYLDGRPSTGNALGKLKDAPFLLEQKAAGQKNAPAPPGPNNVGWKGRFVLWGWPEAQKGEKQFEYKAFRVAQTVLDAQKVNGFPSQEDISTIQVKWRPAWKGTQRPAGIPAPLNSFSYVEKGQPFLAEGRVEDGWNWDNKELGSVTIVYGKKAELAQKLVVKGLQP